MLFLLTGDIQTGKTRWLQQMLGELEDLGVTACGVVAPGVWRERRDEESNTVAHEKLGIDNVLLPEGRSFPFARRRDLVDANERDRTCTQAETAQLGWSIDDHAIDEVDAHLRRLMKLTGDGAPAASRLLVIDELGRLELEMGRGLASGIEIVERGATDALPDAIVVVRRQLLETALNRFASAPWGGTQPIGPDAGGRDALLSACVREWRGTASQACS